ncbi:MAG: phenylalanine--tRNA ligase subunit beta [Phycisphaeraceae bacterium]|nr:MAG: phenylalanine--tRNA ligase subunit beta [Phycisphaeraceae bacterium]
MLISLKWLNRLLEPGDLSADDVERALTHAGFPVEGREELSGADVRLDVEITSNRGDCISHIGLAREVAAATGRRLKLPEIPFDITLGPGAGDAAEDATSVDNQTPEVCPRFTARVIRNVKVGPSPKWLVEALEAVGQRSINNVVDASNYVLFELGNPTHTFDMKTLAEQRLIVRYAKKDEPLVTLEGKKHALRTDELVVADAERAVSLAGVIGGLDSAVTEKTTDILLEAATWDPATIRRAARRLRIITDAGHRFERVVSPRTVDFAAARVAAIILETGGGEMLAGAIAAGPELTPPPVVSMRAARCTGLLGIELSIDEMANHLEALGVACEVDAATESVRCETPDHRTNDLRREVDLIEEVARVHGYEKIPVREKIEVAVAPPQESERAQREIGSLLAGLGFYETVTFSFVTAEQAASCAPPGMRTIKVDEERRKGAPYLRPSVWPSLLECRRVNQDAGVRIEEGVRLFEFGAGFLEKDAKGRDTVETRWLAMIMDAPDRQEGLRRMRGVIETLVRTAGGAARNVEVTPRAERRPIDDPDASADIAVDGRRIGVMSLVAPAAMKVYELDAPVVAAELDADALLAMYPPKSSAAPLPAFPGIERDLSIIVDEQTPWAKVANTVEQERPEKMTGLTFVGVYRGKQVGAGKKSVTLRLRFLDPERTLRHEEVDPQMQRVVKALGEKLGAELRA